MKTNVKQFVTLAAGAFLLFGLAAQTAQAQTVMSGTATLATAGTAPGQAGAATAPPAITVTYLVTLANNVYTYQYTVANPSGNVVLGGSGGPNGIGTTFTGNGNGGKPAVVNSFSVSFDTTATGIYTAVTPPAGTSVQNNGVNGLLWTFGPVGLAPSSSIAVSFQSANPPTMSNACAMGPNPPGPWASSPSGQQVPVPIPGQVVSSGSASLAANGASAPLSVTYFVTLTSGVYTYIYTLNNPSGDVYNGSPAQGVEFDVFFNSLYPGAYVNGSGGELGEIEGYNVNFSFNLNPGNSTTVSFQSQLQPQPGLAPGPAYVHGSGEYSWGSTSAGGYPFRTLHDVVWQGLCLVFPPRAFFATKTWKII